MMIPPLQAHDNALGARGKLEICFEPQFAFSFFHYLEVPKHAAEAGRELSAFPPPNVTQPRGVVLPHRCFECFPPADITS